ncbi:MAG: phosphotransferase, partial [Gammaproteobacteria bacterium]|nr:phosphotransferase [Gammaproteobacteria bacterium]
MNIPLDPAAITCDWLTHALRDSKLLSQDRNEHVVDFEMEVIGEGAGFMGEIIRMNLSLSSAETNSPTSMILKIPTTSKNRQVGQSMGIYEREIRFYKELQPRVNVRTPAFFYGAMEQTPDPAQGLAILRFLNRMPIWLFWIVFRLLNWFGSRKQLGFVLLIEDLGHLRVGDQVAGCSSGDAKRALNTMASLQTRFWQSQTLTDLLWIVPFELLTKITQVFYLQALPKYLTANKDQLSYREKQLLEWLKVNAVELMNKLSNRPYTLLHGDFRLDNIFFDDENDDVVLMDWQSPGCGPAGLDLSYFLSASMAADVTDQEMDQLIEYYRCQLAENGVEISNEQMRWDYEAGMLVVLLRVIPAEHQDVLNLGDDRGHDLVITWI